MSRFGGSSVRRTLDGVVKKARAKAGDDVLPFGKKKPKKKRSGNKAEVVTLKPANANGDIFVDKKGRKYRKIYTSITNKLIMVRQDGAIFVLRKDGKWVHQLAKKKKTDRRK